METIVAEKLEVLAVLGITNAWLKDYYHSESENFVDGIRFKCLSSTQTSPPRPCRPNIVCHAFSVPATDQLSLAMVSTGLAASSLASTVTRMDPVMAQRYE